MRITRTLILALLVTLTLGLADSSLLAQTTATQGRVINGPSNITSFSPRDTSISVDAASVNLRDVFEDLGPDATLWYQHVQTLSNPYFAGRVPGTRGGDLAGNYITWYFESYGLRPPFESSDDDERSSDGSYFQPFTFSQRGGAVITRVRKPFAAVGGRELKYETDYAILGNSGSGTITAPITFLGYSIEEGEDGYSSFDEDTDLSGRIAVMLRYEPLDKNGQSQWSEKGFSRHISLKRKMRAAKSHGAEGIILINPPGAILGRTGLDSLERSSQFGRSIGIPVMQLSLEAGDELLKQADSSGRDLMAFRRLADAGSLSPIDFDDDLEVTISAKVRKGDGVRRVNARNCGGVLRGQGALADEWLVIGGHHDHVGIGELHGVRGGNQGRLHPGADDNASGTAGVLVLAKKLSEYYEDADVDEDLRSILFLTFDAEEQGLFGSDYYASHPTIEPEQITMMMNMDMIGRVRSSSVMVLGTQTGEGLEDLLIPHFESSGMTVAITPRGSGRSDDANFHDIGVPAIHFFSGMHDEYHAPGDKSHTVNPAGATDVIELMYEISVDLVTREEKLEYQGR